MARDRTAEPVSRDQNIRREQGQDSFHFPGSADHEQDWQPYQVDPYSAVSDDHTLVIFILVQANHSQVFPNFRGVPCAVNVASLMFQAYR